MKKSNWIGGLLSVMVLLLVSESSGQTWLGSGDGIWTQPDSDSDWDATYSSGNAVTFDDSVTGTRTVTVDAGGVTPGNLAVGGAGDYVLTGGDIGGNGALTKSDAGTLRLEGTHSFVNGSGRSLYTSGNAGIIDISGPGALGTGSFQFGYGSSIIFSNSTAGLVTLSNDIMNGGGSQNLYLKGTPLKMTGNIQFNNSQGKIYAQNSGTNIISGTVISTGTQLFGPGNFEITGPVTGGFGLFDSGITVGIATSLGAGETILKGANGCTLYGIGGALVLTNDIALSGYGENEFYFIGTNDITFSGSISDSSGGSNRSYAMDVTNGLTVTFSGVIPGVLGSSGNYYTKWGDGLLVFSGANTYSFRTYITGGTMRADDGQGLPSDSYLSLEGGVLETSGTFDRTLAAKPANGVLGSDTFRWYTSGGFSAYGGALTVDINGGGADNLTWGSGSFVSGTLILGSAFANDVVTMVDNIDLGSGTRTVHVDDNAAVNIDRAVLSGVLSGTGGIIKSGDGTLFLNGDNLYTGSTTVNAGGIGGNGAIDGNLVLATGGRLDVMVGNTLDVDGDVDLSNTDSLHLIGSLPTDRSVILTYTGSLTGVIDSHDMGDDYGIDYSVNGEIAIYLKPPEGTVITLK